MNGDSSIPLIIGRSFLATSKALIDLSSGKIKLWVNSEDITFNLDSTLRHPMNLDDSCFSMDFIDHFVKVNMNELLFDDLILLALCEDNGFVRS